MNKKNQSLAPRSKLQFRVAESGLVPVQLTGTCGSWHVVLPHADTLHSVQAGKDDP